MTQKIDPSGALPPETFSYLLSFLEPPALARCLQVSSAWNAICTDEALWRDQAIRLGYCQSERQAEERSSGIRVVATVLQKYEASVGQAEAEYLLQATIQRYRSRNTTSYFDDCHTWRSLCCLLWRLDCNWSAKDTTGLERTRAASPSPNADDTEAERSESETASSDREEQPGSSESDTKPYLLPRRRVLHEKMCGTGVWRCKIDPEERTYIVTGQHGGIQVFDHTTETLLWHIARTATRANPHLEFSRGWMIFDRPGIGHFEVWRRESLVPDLGRPPDRGHYQRFAVLSSTRPIRAYRFQFPYLCAASQDGFILIWDVPQQELVETIDFRDSPHRGGNINYIDFDDEFVFLNGLGAKSVSVFSRRTKRLVWNMGQHFAAGQPPPTTWRLEPLDKSAFPENAFVRQQLVRAPPNLWQAGPNSMNWAQLTMTPYQIWSAVHPDLKTKTLLVLGQGTVLLIRDYKKFFNNPTKPPGLFVEIEFQNLEEYYRQYIVGGVDEEVSDLGWNNPRMWETLGDAQLTVHEGRAVVVNDRALILDLCSETFAQEDSVENTAAQNQTQMQMEESSSSEPAEQPHDNDGDTDSTDTSAVHAEPVPPPITVYCELNRSPRDSYRQCSSLQMDEVGVYLTADRDAFGEMYWGGVFDTLSDGKRQLLHLDSSARAGEGTEGYRTPEDVPREM
ncbi:Quinonprotein alcohol dehydrogenase-like superfamily [Kalmanozyma brasiliensis GHG001]|uniref:F-box domain-containing protein n=1 Tax=Kalmanozyma brasiliensis (strain GHG001) TaxID=1365824 RepID=V5EU56_KALBG|nr:Quinonprotein alcohol dehydrogenase-like superfamily [Kalmanozyma brasiliensis GHG001]EST05594.1 Quinonprotein alcohol dehydrogenase-like superfamily [Kalmanozyma brasiliensis GHG001]